MEVGESGGGGDVESVAVRNFLAARVQEINSLSYQIGTSGVPTSKGLAFQHVPKHMRRRAVSHNPKRLPKRLRPIHINQIEKSSGGLVKKPKKPSRKHRRRKSNLLEEYNRRQRSNKWLETHIWHAKRFFMENKWGYRIPIRPTDKGYRALYRAARDFTSMRDVSFLSCLQLEGDFDLISSTITGSFAPQACNQLGVGATTFRNGGREGSLYFYKSGCYPQGYVGKVRFNWTKISENLGKSKLLMWVHPAQKDEVLNQLCEEFELICIHKKTPESENIKEERMEVDADEEKVSIDDVKLEPKNLLERPVWKNPTSGLILTDLEGVFNRFRLYGPMSTSTLKEILKPLTAEKIKQNQESRGNWWQNYFVGEEKSLILKSQKELWNNLEEFHQVPCNTILPLVVNDPRLIIPEKRTKIKEKQEVVECSRNDSEEFSKYLEAFNKMGVGESPLWNENVRDALVKEKMSDYEFSKRRSSLLIPGSKIDLGEEENQVPIVLIHRPSLKTFGFQNGGWDIILPAGWAMSFWVTLSYRAARACGLRDSTHYEFESASTFATNEDEFPFPPDSFAGTTEDGEISLQLQSKYFKYPPAKRVNYLKLKCPFPFLISWWNLLKYLDPSLESSKTQNFSVLRDSLILKEIGQLFKNKKDKEDCPSAAVSSTFDKFSISKNLVGVRLKIFGKGVIESGALICIPSPVDLQHLEKSPAIPALELEQDLSEPAGDDSANQKARVELYTRHQKIMSFVRTKRKKLRKKKQETCTPEVSPEEIAHYDSKNLSEAFNVEMNSLWLPDCDSVLKSQSRVPIGVVVFGHESFAVGKCTGLGYCAGSGLKQWMLQKHQETTGNGMNSKRLVLVRNCRSSLIYRWAQLDICQLS